MPVYKQYNYKKIRDCNSCKYFKERCRHPCPNEHNCNFKTIKSWSHKYYVLLNINGRRICKRGFSSRNIALYAECILIRLNEGDNPFINYPKLKISEEDSLKAASILKVDKNIINYLFKNKKIQTYKELLNEYGNYISENYKSTYSNDVKRQIKNFYYTLFPDIPINKLLKSDADEARKKIDSLKVNIDTKKDKLSFLIRFFSYVEKYHHYRYEPIFLLNEFREYKIKRIKPKEEIVSFEEFQKIYSLCDDEYFKLAFLTLFIYGLRISELLGLKVDSFDFKKLTMEIYQGVTFKDGKGKGEFSIITPKTPKSERLNNMPIIYSELVKKHVERHKLQSNDYVFYRLESSHSEEDHQKPLHENSFRRIANEYCKKYNEDFHPHMLRTSIVTHLRDKGVPLEEISEYIGHKGTKVTMQYYSKTSKKRKEMINEAIEEYLSKII